MFELFLTNHTILVKKFTSKYANVDIEETKSIQDLFGSDGLLTLVIESVHEIARYTELQAMERSEGLYVTQRSRNDDDDEVAVSCDNEELKSKLKRMDTLASSLIGDGHQDDLTFVDDDGEEEEEIYEYEYDDLDEGCIVDDVDIED